MRAAGVESLIARMTLEEKLSLIAGARDPHDQGQAGYWPGLPRLGIPPLRFADGPGGINAYRDATALPAPVGLAATFDPEAARLYGALLGREARALGQQVVLAPYVNIVRDPFFRRNHATLGEDPLLNARLAVEIIRGIQSQGVMAQVKHLAAYNGQDNVYIDERTLREIYLPAFEAAVKAGVASVMCAYNRVNGQPCCATDLLLCQVLRNEWGFKGFVTSDWGALPGPEALVKGADLEMPGRPILGRPGPFFDEPLRQAIREGRIPAGAVDEAVRRILTQVDRFGWLDGKPAKPGSINVQADASIARRLAAQSAVLLKNDGLLPLAASDLESLAVIGPTARQLAAGYMGERAYGFEDRLISPLDALRKLAPRARITFAVGDDLTGVELPTGNGTLEIPEDGEYTFMVQTSGGDGEILLNGRVVVQSSGFRGFGSAHRKWSSLLPTIDGLDNSRATVRLTTGRYRLQTRTAPSRGGSPRVRFAWMTPALRRRNLEEAVTAASNARTAIVFLWHEQGASFNLAENQDELVRRVSEVNRRTVVVLNAGGPVAMPWLERAGAVLLMWYPGQEGGWATADLLLGRAGPGGRLPVTFPKRPEDTPALAPGHPERWATPPPPGKSGIDAESPPVTFSEGIAVGYRWYDQQNIEPLFPFGFGLSYASFEYSALQVKRGPGGIQVNFALRNTGSRRGIEVAQVYLDPGGAPAAPRTLAGFKSVELKPGETQRITIQIDARSLCYWSQDQRAWVEPAGPRTVFVGASSRDIRLAGRIPATIQR